MSDWLIEKIMSRVEKDANGCWNSGWEPTSDYSRIWWRGRSVTVHRVMYEHHVGPLDPSLTIDHLCFNKRCCNPAHLEQVPREVNSYRGYERSEELGKRGGPPGTTHCPQGHKYTDADRKPSGAKQCRRCENERRRIPQAA